MSTITIQDLTEQEKHVLDAVLEYLDQNKPFNITEALPFIISRFRSAAININKIGIKATLRSLIKKSYIFEDSKLTKTTILENEIRRKIYAYIIQNPGTYFNRLIKFLNLNNKIIVWHVRILEKFKFIQRELFDNRYIYFDAKSDYTNAKWRYIVSKEKSKQIIEYIKDNNVGLSLTHLSNALNMHSNTVKKYLDYLTSMNVISKEKIDNNLLYFLK